MIFILLPENDFNNVSPLDYLLEQKVNIINIEHTWAHHEAIGYPSFNPSISWLNSLAPSDVKWPRYTSLSLKKAILRIQPYPIGANEWILTTKVVTTCPATIRTSCSIFPWLWPVPAALSDRITKRHNRKKLFVPSMVLENYMCYVGQEWRENRLHLNTFGGYI